jgi:hypothetical protein
LVALAIHAAVCLLPENDYRRWQSLDGAMYEHLHWMYERIHFDPKPIDIAIFGLSRTKVGLSAAAVERRLALCGKQANVANSQNLPRGLRQFRTGFVARLSGFFYQFFCPVL